MGEADRIKFRIPYRPKSKKNGRPLWKAANGKRRPGVDGQVQHEAADIARLARNAMRLAKLQADWIGDHDVEIRLVDYPRQKAVEVEVIRLGPRQKGVTGRDRDLDNIYTSVQDAMRREVYPDDNQVARFSCERRLDP